MNEQEQQKLPEEQAMANVAAVAVEELKKVYPTPGFILLAFNPETGEMRYTSNAKRLFALKVMEEFIDSNRGYVAKERLTKLRKARR